MNIFNKKRSFMKKISLFLSVFCLINLFNCAFVFAKESNKLQINNVFQTDKVNIELINNLGTSTEKINVMPGASINMSPRINNLGASAYVRAKITFTSTFEGGETEKSLISSENLKDVSEKWVYNENDGYYYYNTILNPEETSDTIFTDLVVPSDYSYPNSTFEVKIVADAIQSKNFNPDFSSIAPWGNVEIKEYLGNNSYKYEKTDSTIRTFTITYSGSTNELISNSSDFFSNIPTLVPGDTYSDSFNIYNRFDKTISIYFTGLPNLEDPERDQIRNELLGRISLKIFEKDSSNNDTVIFEGNLAEPIDNIIIAALKANESKDIYFTIHFDENANNDFTELDSLVSWYFTAKYSETEEPVVDPDKPDVNPDTPGEKTDNPEKPSTPILPGQSGPHTGVENIAKMVWMKLSIFAFLAVVSGLSSLYIRKRLKTVDDKV